MPLQDCHFPPLVPCSRLANVPFLMPVGQCQMYTTERHQAIKSAHTCSISLSLPLSEDPERFAFAPIGACRLLKYMEMLLKHADI